MGFFASRWIEKHGAETEKAALSTPTPAAVVPAAKTKWVGYILFALCFTNSLTISWNNNNASIHERRT